MKDYPEGWNFINISRIAEEKCAKESIAGLKQHHTTHARLEQLGVVLSYLYRFSCCYWGCHRRAHVIEYLAGRAVTSSGSALRVLFAGYYDESLALVRNVAEVGNLMNLFLAEPSNIRLWLDLPEHERRKKFGPVAVRKALENAWGGAPISAEKYAWLSSIGVHAAPNVLPGAHNPEGRPILGCVFQQEGADVATSRLAWSVCTVAGPAAKLSALEGWPAERMVDETIRLAEMLDDE
jgi:hypothetical protein